MSFKNSYVGPDMSSILKFTRMSQTVEDWGPDPYDINFCIPIDVSQLHTDRLKLTPFIPRLHAEILLHQLLQHPELELFFPYRTRNLLDVLSHMEEFWRQNPENVAFTIIDKTKPDAARPDQGGTMVGVVGLLKTSVAALSTEIAWILTFPAYQRAGVATAACAVLLRYCLATPSEPQPGLGLRRVQWFVNALNSPSIGLAERLGFKTEGTLRWVKHVPAEWPAAAHNRPNRPGDPAPERLSRDMVMMAFCADDWEEGGRGLVQGIIDQKNH